MKLKALVMTVITVALGATLLAQDQARERKLQQAIDLLETKGDAVRAMPLLEDVAKSADQALAARGLLYLGQAQERQGQDQARRTYEQIIQRFASQSEIVAQARARLNGLIQAADTGRSALTIRHVADSVDPWSAVSRDGRYVTSTEWPSGNLILRDLSTGTVRILATPDRPKAGYAEDAVFSPSGKHIVYGFSNPRTPTSSRYDLRLIPVDGTAKAARVLLDQADVSWVGPYDWSADGRRLALALIRADRSQQMALLSVNDGAWRVIKTFSKGREVGKARFSPDGRALAFESLSAEDGRSDIFVMATDGTGERAIVVHPSDDRLGAWTPDGRSLLFASDRAGSFGVYSVATSSGEADGAVRLIKGGMGALTPVGLSASGSFLYNAPAGGISDIHIATIDLTSGRLTSGPEPIPDFMGANTQPQWSDDGKYLVYVRRPDNFDTRRALLYRRGAGTRSAIIIRSLETNSIVRELRPQLKVFNGLRPSPDGRSLIVNGTDLEGRRGLFRIDVATSDMALVAHNATSPAWFPDGRKLFYILTRETETAIVEYDTASTRSAELTRGKFMASLRIAPDGRKLYFRRDNGNRELVEFVERELASGAERTIAKGAFSGLNLTPDGKWIATHSSGQPLLMDVTRG